MTVEELARAMEKDTGEPDNFIRKNKGTWISWYFICNKTKVFKDENLVGGLKTFQLFQYFPLQVTYSNLFLVSLPNIVLQAFASNKSENDFHV